MKNKLTPKTKFPQLKLRRKVKKYILRDEDGFNVAIISAVNKTEAWKKVKKNFGHEAYEDVGDLYDLEEINTW